VLCVRELQLLRLRFDKVCCWLEAVVDSEHGVLGLAAKALAAVLKPESATRTPSTTM
jgi:hypothetical protein